MTIEELKASSKERALRMYEDSFLINKSIPFPLKDSKETYWENESIVPFLDLIKEFKKREELILQSYLNTDNRCPDDDLIASNEHYSYCQKCSSLNGAFLTTTWALTEVFLSELKKSFNNLSAKRSNTISKPSTNFAFDKYKKWFMQKITTDKIKYYDESNNIRLLCNNFKHNGKLDKVLPEKKTKKSIGNKGVKDISSKHLKKYYNPSITNPSYCDLDIERMMYDQADFCLDIKEKIINKYKSTYGIK